MQHYSKTTPSLKYHYGIMYIYILQAICDMEHKWLPPWHMDGKGALVGLCWHQHRRANSAGLWFNHFSPPTWNDRNKDICIAMLWLSRETLVCTSSSLISALTERQRSFSQLKMIYCAVMFHHPACTRTKNKKNKRDALGMHKDTAHVGKSGPSGPCCFTFDRVKAFTMCALIR